MSLIRPLRVIGLQRTRTHHYFWCRRCERSVRIFFTYPYEASCPHCLGQLHHVLGPGLSRPRLLTNVTRIDPNLLNSLAEMLQNSNFNWRIRWEPENGDFQFVNRTPLPIITSLNENTTPSITNLREIGDENPEDWPGPPPAPISEIENLGKMRLTCEHLANDSNCPVCKDEFEVGMEVKVMPCKHFYHPECIDPWLNRHNTCPVCRYELPVLSDNNDFQDNFENFHFEDFRSAMSWSWDRMFSFWPFHLFSNWGGRGFNVDDSSGANPWWRTWSFL